MSDQPDLSTLPQRMRYAATVLEEASRIYGLNESAYWRPWQLQKEADQVEAEDRAGDELVDELAPLLSVICDEAAAKDRGYVYVARKLVESGWRKGDPA